MNTHDVDGYVTNSPATYKAIATGLKNTTSPALFLRWTEGRGTELEILLAYHPVVLGPLQGRTPTMGCLMVGVVGYSVFGFQARADADVHPEYVAEKLRMHPESVTTAALADLINGCLRELAP